MAVSEKKRRRRRIIKTSRIAALVMLFVSIWFCLVLRGLGFIPGKYLKAVITIMIIINIPLLFFGLVAKVKSGLKKKQMVVCTVLSIILLVMNILIPHYEGKIFKAITKIPDEGGLNINIYTLKENNITDLSQLKGCKIAVQSKLDIEYQDYAFKVITHEIGEDSLVKRQYGDVYAAIDGLLAKDVDAVMLNETYFDIISENADYKEKVEQIAATYVCPVIVKIDYDTSAVGNIDKEPFLVALAATDNWELKNLSSNSYRTDANMVAAVNPINKKVLIISIPRDSYVGMGGDSNKMDKLTHASLGGIDQWKKTLETLLGAKINYFVKVNFTSMINIVDALGGIDVDNPYEFKASVVDMSDPTHRKGIPTTYAQGQIHLTGPQALAYCRERYSLSGGDFARNQHQLIVIKAIIHKVCSAAVITKINSLIEAVGDCYASDIKEAEYKALAQLQLSQWPLWDIEMINLKGSSDFASSYYGGGKLSMVFLSQNSLQDAKTKLQELLNGN